MCACAAGGGRREECETYSISDRWSWGVERKRSVFARGDAALSLVGGDQRERFSLLWQMILIHFGTRAWRWCHTAHSNLTYKQCLGASNSFLISAPIFFYFFLIMTAFVCRARTNILDQSKLWDQLYCGGQTVVLIPVLCRTKTKIYGVFKLMKWFCAAVASAAGRSLGSIESQMELTMLERKKKNCKHFFSN